MIAFFAAISTILAALIIAIRSGGLAWLGGARLELLERASVDTSAFTSRGIAVTIPALFGAFAMTAALEYGQQLKPLSAAAGGAAWGLIVLFFDLSIMGADIGGDSVWSWARGMIFLALRATAAVLAALVISSMIALFWYRTDIAIQLQRDNQAAARTYTQTYIDPHYTPQINQDQTQALAGQERLSADAQAVTNATNAVNRAELAVQCEKGGVSDVVGCPAGSGEIGSGPVTAVRIAEYQDAAAALARAESTQQADQARLLPQISRDQADASALQSTQDRAEAAELTFQTSHNGLLARQLALSELERADPGVGGAVTVMELLIIIVDCTAVIAKITSRTPAYDRVAQAERHRAIRRAERDEAFTDTEIQVETRIHQARWQAFGDAEEARISAWRDAAIPASGWAGSQDDASGPDPGGTREAAGQQAGSEPPSSGAHEAPGPAGPRDDASGPDPGATGEPAGHQAGPWPPPSGADEAPGPAGPQQEADGGEAGQVGGQSLDPEQPVGSASGDDEFAGDDPFTVIRDRLGWEEET